MTHKKKTATKKTTRRKSKPRAPHVYREPHTATEMNIDCSVCHAPAEWFDYGRGNRDHRSGFICSAHPRSPNSEKLLVKPSAPAAA
jgi:hypothetical protein